MSVGTLLSVDEYLRTSFDPDCDFIDGEVQERNAEKRNHSYAQGEIVSWFNARKEVQRLQSMPELRMRVGPNRIRIPDVAVSEMPLPDEEVLTSPPYLCVEVMSPDDTIAAYAPDIPFRGAGKDQLDDYLQFGVLNIWVVDPYKHRGWSVTVAGWATAAEGVMRTADGRIAMPLADVLLP